jgi:hypothetical protein
MIATMDRSCSQCGGQIEAGTANAICFGCHLDGLVPKGYQTGEKYEFVPAFLHPNATERPPTGVEILDMRSAPMIRAMCLTTSKRPRSK